MKYNIISNASCQLHIHTIFNKINCAMFKIFFFSFTSLSSFFTHIETNQSVGGAKTKEENCENAMDTVVHIKSKKIYIPNYITIINVDWII